MTIYVGNISYSLGEEDLRKLFEEMGTVDSVKLIVDKRTGRSKGYCFVEMPDKKEAMEAIKSMDGREVAGRNFRVITAHSTKKIGEGAKV
jgi:RNA recognition motif-containing protein